MTTVTDENIGLARIWATVKMNTAPSSSTPRSGRCECVAEHRIEEVTQISPP